MESQHLQYQSLLEMNAVQAMYDQIEFFHQQFIDQEIGYWTLIASIKALHNEIDSIVKSSSPLVRNQWE